MRKCKCALNWGRISPWESLEATSFYLNFFSLLLHIPIHLSIFLSVKLLLSLRIHLKVNCLMSVYCCLNTLVFINQNSKFVQFFQGKIYNWRIQIFSAYLQVRQNAWTCVTQTPVVTLNVSISPESSMPSQSILANLSPSHSRGMYPFFRHWFFFPYHVLGKHSVSRISLCIIILDLFMLSRVLIIYFFISISLNKYISACLSTL